MKKVFSCLILCIFCVFTMVGCGKSDQDFYNEGVKVLYERVDKNLNYQISRITAFDVVNKDRKIDAIRFTGDNTEIPNVEILFEGAIYKNDRDRYVQGSVVFSLQQKYYETLKNLGNMNNVVLYLEALNDVFMNMEYRTSENHVEIAFLKNVEKTEENFSKINDLLKLDFTYPDIVRQVGFVPFNIELVETSFDEFDPDHAQKYTYLLHGISYCETISEHTEDIKDGENLVLESNYDKNHIKAFYRDIVISSTVPLDFTISNYFIRLAGDLYLLCIGEGEYYKTVDDFEVQTTYFEETNVFDEFLTMRETSDFNYKMPDDFTFQREILGTYKLKSITDYDKKYCVGDVVENERITEDWITITIYVYGENVYYVGYNEIGSSVHYYYLRQKDGDMYLTSSVNGEIQATDLRVVIEKDVLTLYATYLNEDPSSLNHYVVLIKK